MLLLFLLLFFGSYCVKFFDMHKHETIMMTRFLMILCRAPRHPPGKEDVVKSVGVIFYLFCGCLLQEARLLMLSKWVSEWVSDGYNRIPILIQFLLDVNCATHSLFWSTKEDEKHLTIISRWRVKKPKFFLYHIRWSAQHENLQENFFL